MTQKSDVNYSSLGINHIRDRDQVFKNADLWLEDKKRLDGAEGLWRVYDNLYDLSNFIEKHPGGKFWLEITKGIDVTEAFESHHISTKPEEILKTFFVRKAKTPRYSPFTFEENGFYKTLKRNVRGALKNIPQKRNAITKTKMITDFLLIGAFCFSILAVVKWSFMIGIFAAILLSSLSIASHNYYHQKDNFRMYYSDIALVPSREWRIIHVLSHHAFTNTIADMQAYITEPMLYNFPHIKSKWVKYASWIYGPLVVWPAIYSYLFSVRMYQWVVLGYNKHVNKIDFLPFLLPLTMYLFSGQSLLMVIGMWIFIILFHSFWFCFVGLATTHFHPDLFMDGDKPRPKHEADWGINQLDTVSDRYEITGNDFLVLLNFGDHALHHLFPTLDHGILHYLYPVVEETMKQFNVDIRMTTQTDMLGGYFRQLSREKFNPNPPTSVKSKQENGFTKINGKLTIR